ncbi:hypothetical protein CBS63078_2704 [Aspergillus niger]|uniref:Contig An03c0200, genomic contig n=5 Tax=Aspergillus TaxID=5052 RepID=A2QHC0_ASPNC|nr:uncharacterized protein An03g06340 [Aspergillus niger]XP_025456639.1 uncharacterized protein BO96DRAFT_455280 [Aspergillus niger CBS 101883]EHA21365.1 hypothetical protein ASPNIDRAFT_44588 [Aspergillus niger ATCC 1015]RDH22950.1 hypothetical protein M747DRAFT_339305 [Aspergillus niger ATCC 13496]RDK38982.1 hypothetical protein M752DRAFT_305467 [Aspergillus phoenicis ATCC 13157]KAI2822207.1 hypothetical protein CBS115989_2221 [Aspergillus niger]KAI2831555.1 hypothetical protein CBS133816_24|eukprot:XP_001390509.1 hypothetical protein ANI_1_1538034 [Aspergillus niger CBS 513.88]
MTSTTTTAAASSTTCGGSGQYELPVKDAACGIPNIKNYQSLFDDCAKPAGPRSYYHDCALWAYAIDQSVQNLTDCLYKAGVAWEDVWCTGETNATATVTSYPTATATGTLVTKSEEATETGSSTSSTASETGSKTNAAYSFRGRVSTKLALGLLGLVVTGAMSWV